MGSEREGGRKREGDGVYSAYAEVLSASFIYAFHLGPREAKRCLCPLRTACMHVCVCVRVWHCGSPLS